mmetsp:Transcript_32567/g.107403  ORF Transcript_32567/g.107403 Transcript_32567/m.107403 type:complete len:366 (-) Transcript_32567:73-1170(-)
MASESALCDKLSAHGFVVKRKLVGTAACSIFCVASREDPDGELCAAKIVNLEGLDVHGRSHAQQEVSFLKGIAAHPNLIAYRDSFVEAPHLFIVMSLAEDGDLRQVVKEASTAQRALPEFVVLSWLGQLLRGLAHMHAQDVLHRDLKSSNVFLSGGRRHLRIGDFGISTVLESVSFATSCVGTPAYMAPEILHNERYDFHADMWAVGCICYELCTLEMPFQAANLIQLFAQVTDMEPDWEHWRGFSEELRSVAWRLLQKNASKRPTAQGVLDEALFSNGEETPEELWAQVTPTEVSCGGGKRECVRGKSLETLGSTVSTAANSPVGSDKSSRSSTLTHSLTDSALNIDLADFKRMLEADRETQLD